MNTLFASFDLVNSTAYKYKYQNWFDLYNEILTKIVKEAKDKTDFLLWKGIGDELVFKKELLIQELENDITRINNIMETILIDLYSDEKKRIMYPGIKQLSIKTTIWIAHTSKEIINQTDYEIKINDQVDYLGKEMDTGFRVSSHALRSKTILSAAVVFILLMNSNKILKKIKIIGYNKLKGIWENNDYPICVYFRNRNIIKSFHQPEQNIEIVKTFIEKYEKNHRHGEIKKSEFLEYLDYLGIKEKYKSDFV